MPWLLFEPPFVVQTDDSDVILQALNDFLVLLLQVPKRWGWDFSLFLPVKWPDFSTNWTYFMLITHTSKCL